MNRAHVSLHGKNEERANSIMLKKNTSPTEATQLALSDGSQAISLPPDLPYLYMSDQN